MSDLEPVFQALAAERRRVVLRCLQEHDELTLADLAELVVEIETGESVAVLPAERISRVYHSLYHTHLPRLREADLVRYDQEADRVRATDRIAPALVDAREEIDSLVRA